MPETPAGWGLLVAVVVFVAFLLLKLRVSLRPRDPEVTEARRKIAQAKRRARGAGEDADARARAWLDASRIALAELDRPGLAASYARRALRADPDAVDAVDQVVAALEQGSRHRTLERFLWRRLDGAPGPAYDRAFSELLRLYDGPLHRPERAAALRALRRRAGEA